MFPANSMCSLRSLRLINWLGWGVAVKIAKKKAHRPVDVPLLLAYNVTIVVVEGVCC